MKMLSSVLLIMFLACDSQNTEKRTVSHISQEWGIRFDHPKSFSVGRYRIQADEEKESFGDSLVLIEKNQIGNFDLQQIPIGDVPTISMKYLKAPDAQRYRAMLKVFFNDKVESKKLGKRSVHIYPGIPGPFGDQACLYVVPWNRGGLLQIIGHRFYRKRSKADGRYPLTNYDTIIESIVETLEVQPEIEVASPKRE